MNTYRSRDYQKQPTPKVSFSKLSTGNELIKLLNLDLVVLLPELVMTTMALPLALLKLFSPWRFGVSLAAQHPVAQMVATPVPIRRSASLSTCLCGTVCRISKSSESWWPCPTSVTQAGSLVPVSHGRSSPLSFAAHVLRGGMRREAVDQLPLTVWTFPFRVHTTYSPHWFSLPQVNYWHQFPWCFSLKWPTWSSVKE